MSGKVFVCDDAGGSKWYFQDGKYIREGKGGGFKIAQIRGKSLPDPVELWAMRCDKYGLPHDRIEVHVGNAIVRLKPTNATFALYKHWQEVKDAHAN